MKALTLSSSVLALSALLFAAPAFAQSTSGCDTAATKEDEETLGASGKQAAPGQGGEGTTETTQAAPKKCPPEVDLPGKNR
jgi:hypothetical protein